MNTRRWRIESGVWTTRSVLECGSRLPLSARAGAPACCRLRPSGPCKPATCRRSGFSPFRASRDVSALAQRQSARGLAHSKTWRRVLAFFLLPCACCFRVLGQSYSIDWQTIDGGGGTSTGGVYSVSGTIGQPDAGATMSGGNFSLDGGFWGVVAAVQTPGAPLLTITLNPQLSTTTISWPSPSTGWRLQENTNSVSSANWNDHPFPQDNGTIKYITVNPPTGNRFYRLQK
jgi:hypothetical protein